MQNLGGRPFLRLRLMLFVVFGNLAIMLTAGMPGFADIIYVDADASGADNGTSWADAFTSLEDGLNASVSGDQIWVAAAENGYMPEKRKCAEGARGKAFQLKNGVAVFGGFDGTEAALSERDWEANQTILTGELGVDPDEVEADGNNCYHVFYHPPELALNNTSVLDGFVIRDGVALFEPGNWDFPDNAYGTEDFHKLVGAGIYNEEASPTIRNCTFTAGKAFGGGGICNINASPVIESCNFTNNVTMFGGGISNLESSSPVIDGCSFSYNAANGSVSETSGRGGGIYNETSSATVTNCNFFNNGAVYGGGMYEMASTSTITTCDFSDNAALYGGGMCNVGSSAPTVSDCLFKENAATGSFDNGTGCGGAVYSEAARPEYTNCIFMRNIALAGGAMANWESSATVVQACRFLGNGEENGKAVLGYRVTTAVGGAALNYNAEAIYINSVFTGNQAELGGGHYNEQSSLLLINCTLSGNNAYAGEHMAETGLGGGLLNVNSELEITNSILWDNQADTEGPEIYNEFANTRVRHSNIRNGFAGGSWNSVLGSNGGNNIDSDPLFVNEPDAGRDQLWGTVDDVYGNFSLLAASPCIDAGAEGEYVPAVDIADNDRDNKVDIGAYEYISADGGGAAQPADNIPAPNGEGGGGCFLSTLF